MIKSVCFFVFITISSVNGLQSLRPEILNGDLIPSALRVSIVRSYIDANNIHGDVQPLPFEPQNGTLLIGEDLDKYFHDQYGIVFPGHHNSFQGNGVMGCIYSIDCDQLSNKIFISFPGNQSLSERARNSFGVTTFNNNIQKSYYDDVERIYANQGHQSFISALYKHVNSKISNYADLNNDKQPDGLDQFEYYFTGYGRGGGLAFICSIKFKEIYDMQINRIKVATFCTPRLINTYNVQSRFINPLGYDNIVHFLRPSDISPKFPFRLVENPGVQILLQPNAFLFRYSHQVPSQEDLEYSINQYNNSNDIGWLYPLNYMVTIETKPLIWGISGAFLSILLLKSSIVQNLSENIRKLCFWVIKRI